MNNMLSRQKPTAVRIIIFDIPFYGIIIQMFWNDHAPPHFHARYGEHMALINIHTLEVIGTFATTCTRAFYI